MWIKTWISAGKSNGKGFSFIHVEDGFFVFVSCLCFVFLLPVNFLYRFLLYRSFYFHPWVSRLSHANLSCHLQEIYLQPSIGLVLRLSIPGKTSRNLNWKMGRSLRHGIFLHFSWRNDLPFTVVWYIFLKASLEAMAPVIISCDFFTRSMNIHLDQQEFLNHPLYFKASNKHSNVFTSALGGFVFFDLAGFKIRILDP